MLSQIERPWFGVDVRRTCDAERKVQSFAIGCHTSGLQRHQTVAAD